MVDQSRILWVFTCLLWNRIYHKLG